MTIVNVHQAKSTLSELLRKVEAGEEVLIARAGKPVARLIPALGQVRRLGTAKGQVGIADDFNAPLPPEVLEQFYK